MIHYKSKVLKSCGFFKEVFKIARIRPKFKNFFQIFIHVPSRLAKKDTKDGRFEIFTSTFSL